MAAGPPSPEVVVPPFPPAVSSNEVIESTERREPSPR